MPFVNAHLTKAEGAHQTAAGNVLDENTRDELPETSSTSSDEQRFHRRAASTSSSRGAGGVNRELGDAGVAIAGTVGRCRGERDQLTVIVLNNDDGVASAQPLHHITRGAVARLERCDPVVDPFVV